MYVLIYDRNWNFVFYTIVKSKAEYLFGYGLVSSGIVYYDFAEGAD